MFLSAIRKPVSPSVAVVFCTEILPDNREALPVADEYDVQDLMHALLKVFFDDVVHEDATPSIASRSSRLDLLIRPDGVVIEAKMTQSSRCDAGAGLLQCSG
jgi:hypothetical protein